VTLHVLLDAGHHEPARATGLDAKAIAGLDSRGPGNRSRDGHLVVRRHLRPPHRCTVAAGMQIATRRWRGWGGWESNPLRLGHRIYSPARLSNSGAPPGRIQSKAASWKAIGSPRLVDSKLGVPVTANGDRVSPLNLAGGNEPLSSVLYQDEQEVETRAVELLDHAGPALVAARGCDLHRKVIGGAVLAARGLDLNPKQRATQVRNQVVVRAVKEGKGNDSTNRGQPLNGRRFAEIPLRAWVESLRHGTNIRSRDRRMARGPQRIHDESPSKGTRRRIASTA
jgi:hypothetical protein